MPLLTRPSVRCGEKSTLLLLIAQPRQLQIGGPLQPSQCLGRLRHTNPQHAGAPRVRKTAEARYDERLNGANPPAATVMAAAIPSTRVSGCVPQKLERQVDAVRIGPRTALGGN